MSASGLANGAWVPDHVREPLSDDKSAPAEESLLDAASPPTGTSFDFIITDRAMPGGMSGEQLAMAAKVRSPGASRCGYGT